MPLPFKTYDPEFSQIMKWIDDLRSSGTKTLLDVGCGYGRFLVPLHQKGIDATGVEVNEDSRKFLASKGIAAQSIEEYQASSKKYDVILMSHIIEHFSPNDLLNFLNSYLSKLNKNGRLIIVTPLLSDYFFDDFDHVKPYLPTSLITILGSGTKQIQYKSPYALDLEKVWFRNGPYRIHYHSALYIKSWMTFPIKCLNAVFAILYWVSRGVIGKRDGWAGMFRLK